MEDGERLFRRAVIDQAAMGEPSAAADLLRANATQVLEDWRSVCTADALVPGPTAAGDADEVPAERARAVVGATGSSVVEALTSLLGSPEGSQHSTSPVVRVADTLAENNIAVGTLVRQFSLLRQILHRHAETNLPPGVVSDAERELDLALDALVEACAARAAERLEKDAFVDPLTGLFNRRGLDRDLPREIAVAERHHRRLSLLVVDVDGLKKINDRQGHTIGDGALRALAGALRGALRGGDAAYRVGGDEFVVLLPDMGAEDVAGFITRVRSGAPPSFSWGAATFPDEVTNRPSLLDLADRRLLAYRGAAGLGRDTTTAAALAEQEPGTRTSSGTRSRSRSSLLVATFLGGVLLGGGSLASAATGTLPGPMQNVAHTVLGKVGLPVPSGKDKGAVVARRRAAPSRFLDDAGVPCTYPDGRPFVGTHGQFVAAHPDIPATPENEREQAARSRCGMPIAGVEPRDGKPAEPGQPDGAGRPEDAGRPESSGRPDDPGKRTDAGMPQDTRPQNKVRPTGTTTENRTEPEEPTRQRPATGGGPSATTTTTTTPPPVAPAEEPPPGPGRSSGRAADRSASAEAPGGGSGNEGGNGAGKASARSGEESR